MGTMEEIKEDSYAVGGATNNTSTKPTASKDGFQTLSTGDESDDEKRKSQVIRISVKTPKKEQETPAADDEERAREDDDIKEQPKDAEEKHILVELRYSEFAENAELKLKSVHSDGTEPTVFEIHRNGQPLSIGEHSKCKDIVHLIEPQSNCNKKSFWNKHCPTLYFEDDDEANALCNLDCKQRIIFPIERTLAEFRNILRSKLRDKEADDAELKGLKLVFIREIPHLSFRQSACDNCGNREPSKIKIKGSGYKYVNPLALEIKKNKNIQKRHLCRECGYFKNLGINTDHGGDSQTVWQPYLLLTGIFMSPALWVSLSLPYNVPVLVLISAIAIIASTTIGICLFCHGYGTAAIWEKITYRLWWVGDKCNIECWRCDKWSRIPMDDNNYDRLRAKSVGVEDEDKSEDDESDDDASGDEEDIKKIERWFKDPYHMLPRVLWVPYMYWVFGSLATLNVFNAFELLRLRYTEGVNAAFECTFNGGSLMGPTTQQCVVYFELIGASTAVFLSMFFVNVAISRRPCWDSGKDRKASLDNLVALAKASDDRGVRMYFKNAIDVIDEVRESDAPSLMPSWFKTVEVPNALKRCCKSKDIMALPTLKFVGIVAAGLAFIGCFALVSLYTHPDAYISALKGDEFHLAMVVVGYAIIAVFLWFYMMVMFKLTMMFGKSHALMKISSDPLKFISNLDDQNKDSGHEERAYRRFLNIKMHFVTPKFLSAWLALREHILKWELRFFYELTQPIISAEIVFVSAMLLLGLIGLFQDDYGGDIRLFLVNMVSESNVAMTLAMFVLLVTFTLFVHLFSLLRPYQEQKAHEKWVKNMAMRLQMEEANMFTLIAEETDDENQDLDCKAVSDSLWKTRVFLDTLRIEMSAKRAAPKLLGVLELNENLIKTIMGFITSSFTAFVASFAMGIMTEIGEESGFTDDE